MKNQPSASAEPSRAVAPPPATARLVTALAAVYVIWGSTYLAIRFAIETLPPLLMASGRFLTAGALLYGWARLRGRPRPTPTQWRAAAIVGFLLLVGGNGAVVVSEQWIPSGMAALVVGTVPLWMVLIDVVWGSRRRPTVRVVLGLLAGFGGVVMLFGAPGAGAGGGTEILGIGLLLAGALSWAGGSIYSRVAPSPPHPFLWVGMQMLCGGVFLAALSLALGEPARFDPGAVTSRSLLALAYLVVFGAIVGYSAYIWLLRATTAARAGTYAYVNPVVAMGLGWLFAGEPVTLRSGVAAAVILGSVALIGVGDAPTRGRGIPDLEATPVDPRSPSTTSA